MKILIFTWILYLVSQLITGYYFFELSDSIWSLFPDGKFLYNSTYLEQVVRKLASVSSYDTYMLLDFIHPIIYTFFIFQIAKFFKGTNASTCHKILFILPALFDYLENISIYFLIQSTEYSSYLLFITPIFSFLKWWFAIIFIFYIIFHVYFEDE